MIESTAEDQTFEKTDFAEQGLSHQEYDNCRFYDCSFVGANLSAVTFIECQFKNCDLSNVPITNTAFKEVLFINCKLLGLRFDECNDFLLALEFQDCQLNLASFYKLKLKNTRFTNCNLQEAEFAETDLTLAKFDNCDLNGAVFENTILERADFRTSTGYSIDPELNRITKAKFSLPEVVGLLYKYTIDIN